MKKHADLRLPSPRYEVAEGVADVRSAMPQPTACPYSRTQVQSEQKTECLSRNRVETPGEKLTPCWRGLRYHSWGNLEPAALAGFRELGSQKGSRRPRRIYSSRGAEFHPRQCISFDGTPSLHTQLDSGCRARRSRSQTVLWTHGLSGVSKRGVRASHCACRPGRDTSGNLIHGILCALRSTWHLKLP